MSPNISEKKISDLPYPKNHNEEAKHASVGDKSNTSSFYDVRNALKKLEAFSLSSSEDINESIEQLIDCIDNNATALNKAIIDL